MTADPITKNQRRIRARLHQKQALEQQVRDEQQRAEQATKQAEQATKQADLAEQRVAELEAELERRRSSS